MGEKRKSKWTLADLSTRAKQYRTRTEFARADQPAYQAARRAKVLEEVCAHMIPGDCRWRSNKPGFRQPNFTPQKQAG